VPGDLGSVRVRLGRHERSLELGVPSEVVFEQMPLPHDLGRNNIKVAATDPQHRFAVGKCAIHSAAH
jgi:hypothetical protein